MARHLRPVIAVIVAFIIQQTASAQSLSINTDGSTAHVSALLDVKSTDKGVLVPRMSKTQKNAIASPATGLMIFQNTPDSIGFHYYSGTAWIWIPGSNNIDTIAWKTGGNSGTNTSNHFFGTRDNIPLSFRQNNTWLGRWNSATGNYFIGDSAGSKITSGINNVSFGSRTMLENTTAYSNVAVGNYSLQNNKTGSRNTAIGDNALFTQSYDPGGSYQSDNTAVGSNALYSNQPTAAGNGGKNVAIGNEALYQNSTGSQNTAIGVSALRENLTGNANTAVGRSAHRLSKTGNSNSYFGFASGFTDSTGSENTGVGTYTLQNHQTGSRNTAVGYYAMSGDSSGNFNTNIGSYASFDSDTADFVTAVGYAALYYNNRDFNTAIGAYAGFQNSRATTNSTQAVENTLVGYAALTGSAFGSQNTAIGFKAMSIFDPNTFYSGAAPFRNVAVGDSALQANRGNDNVGIGFRALSGVNNTNQNQHVAVGSYALTNTTGTLPNTAVGYNALLQTTTGYQNTAIGWSALQTNVDGFLNTALGNAANVGSANLSNTTALGANAYVTQSNSLVLGSISGTNGATANTLVGIGTTSPAARLDVNANFKLGNNGSVLNEIIKVTVNQNIASIAANSTIVEDFVVPGATTTSSVFVSTSSNFITGSGIALARVSAADNVQITFFNTTALAIDNGAKNYYITVIR